MAAKSKHELHVVLIISEMAKGALYLPIADARESHRRDDDSGM
jgi:hypothetical protein